MCQLGQSKTLQACNRSGCSAGMGRELSRLLCFRHCQHAVTILVLAQRGRGGLPMVRCQGTLPAASSPPTALRLPPPTALRLPSPTVPRLADTWLSCCRLGWLSRANSGPPAQLDFVYHQDNANMPIHYLATGPTGWCVHLAVRQATIPGHQCISALSSRT